MNVFFVSMMYPRATHTTLGTFVRDQAKALADLGIDVRICNPLSSPPWPLRHIKRYQESSPDPDYSDILPTARPTWLTFPHRLFETSLRRLSYRSIKSAAKELFGNQRPDIIHAHNLFPVAMACAPLCRSMDIPLVVTTHGVDGRVNLSHPQRRKGVFRAFDAATEVYCVSNMLRNDLIRQGLSGDKMTTVYNGMDISRVYKGDDVEKLRKRFGYRRIILSVGHLVPSRKAFDITIHAFAQLFESNSEDSLALVIVGDGVWRYELEALARKLHIQDKVFFEGNQPPEKTMKYMAACDIFCLPSWYEPFGIVYLEALASGKPIIAVAGQGISELLIDGETGVFVAPKDVNTVKTALDSLIQNPILCRQIGNTGKELVHQKFTWTINATKIIKSYNWILSENP